MGITVIPNCLSQRAPPNHAAGPKTKTIGEIANTGKYYRHPDSALISYPLVVEEPLGSIDPEKPLNIAIVGCGAAAIAALYELCNLQNSESNIRVTLYESDPDHFLHDSRPGYGTVRLRGLRAGRICAAASNDGFHEIDHAVYEIGAMRFPEIAGLTWHYANVVYKPDTKVHDFPNPGTVPTELVHGDRVDRFCNGKWLDEDSPTKHVADVVRNGLFGQAEGDNTSLFLIGGQDPAKISAKLASKETTDDELAEINEQWKDFANEYDKRTLGYAVAEIVKDRLDLLPNVFGITNDAGKISYYVGLFGTAGFGTGGFKSVYNMGLLEMMRLLLWNYVREYSLPVTANVEFIKGLYLKAREKNLNVEVRLARVNDVCHLDDNTKGDALVVYYDVGEDGSEYKEPQKEVYHYVILATTPKQTSYIIRKTGFNNTPNEVTLGDYERPLFPTSYRGCVRPPLVLNNESETVNSVIGSAINHIHMASSSKIFATVKKSEFDSYAPDFRGEGKIKAIVSDCGLGASYVVPSTIPDKANADKYKDYYCLLLSYAWEDDTKKLLHDFDKYPINKDDTKSMTNAVINRTIRDVRDPLDEIVKPWWFGEALSKGNLEAPLSCDWTTFSSSGAFKLDNTGDHYNSNLLYRYHTHALTPDLKNKFFLANDSFSHLGGWVEGAFMSAVNAVCGLIVAANGGNVNALSPEARKVVQSLDSVVEK